MSISRFLTLNRGRLTVYRNVTRGLAILLGTGALYVLIRGVASLVFGGGGEAGSQSGPAGSASNSAYLFLQSLHFAVSALLAWSAGEYLQYVLNDPPRGRRSQLLPGILVLSAGFSVVEWIVSAGPVLLQESGQADSLLQKLTTVVLWQILPLAATLGVTLALVVVVRRLTWVIDEAKELV